jgi:hypothetical protein
VVGEVVDHRSKNGILLNTASYGIGIQRKIMDESHGRLTASRLARDAIGNRGTKLRRQNKSNKTTPMVFLNLRIGFDRPRFSQI